MVLTVGKPALTAYLLDKVKLRKFLRGFFIETLIKQQSGQAPQYSINSIIQPYFYGYKFRVSPDG